MTAVHIDTRIARINGRIAITPWSRTSCGPGPRPRNTVRTARPRRGLRGLAPLRFAHKVPPLGRLPPRDCPLSPSALGGALRSSWSLTRDRSAPANKARRDRSGLFAMSQFDIAGARRQLP